MTNKSTDDNGARLSVAGAIATLTLDRPAAYNAMDLDLARTLRRFAAKVEADDAVRVLVINANGPGFCAGGDISFVANHLDDLPAWVRSFLDEFNEFLFTLVRMPKIVLVAVHGTAAGAGLSLAMMGDLCIAAEDARFVPAYAKLGVTPDCGGTIGVVRAVGVRRALQLFLMEDQMTAQQACEFGLVNRVVPASELIAETHAIAQRLAAFAPEALGPTKRLLSQSPGTPMDQQLNDEMQALIVCMQTPGYRDAVLRFVNK